MTGILSAADLAGLRDVYRDGMETVAAWRNEAPVTFTRLTSTGKTTVVTLMPISIRLADRQPEIDGTPPTTGTTRTGTLKAWTADVMTSVNAGDRFVWQGQPCVVDAQPTTFAGVTTVTFATDSRRV